MDKNTPRIEEKMRMENEERVREGVREGRERKGTQREVEEK